MKNLVSIKSIITFSLLFTLLSFNSYAQGNNQLDIASHTSQVVSFNENIQNHMNSVVLSDSKTIKPRLRTFGIIMTSFGVASTLVGHQMVKNANGVTNYSYTRYADGTTEKTGSMSGTIGALGRIAGPVTAVGGAVFTIIGHFKYTKAKKRNLSYSLGPNSVYLAYRF